MFVALDKLHRQGLKQAIVVVPEKSIGASFADTPLKKFGFFTDWNVAPRWNLCNSRGSDGGKVASVGKFLESGEQDTGLHARDVPVRLRKVRRRSVL